MLVAGVGSSTRSTKVLLCRAEDGVVVSQSSASGRDGMRSAGPVNRAPRHGVDLRRAHLIGGRGAGKAPVAGRRWRAAGPRGRSCLS
jgi:hypothetical protein